MKTLLTKLTTILVCCLIGSLSVGTIAAAAATSEEPITVTVLVLPFLEFAPIFIAEEEGYFAEQGIEIEHFKMDASLRATPLLFQGQLDVIGTVSFASLLNGISKGGIGKIVAGVTRIGPPSQCSVDTICAKKSWIEEGGFKNLKPNQQVSVSVSMGGSIQYYAEKAFEKAGIPEENLVYKELPPPIRIEALQNGSIAVAQLSEPLATRALRTGDVVPWMTASDATPNLQLSVLVYGPRLLTENVGVGEKFMTAYLKAVRQYNQGKTERNIDIITRFTGLDLALVQDACWPLIRDDGAINVESVLDFQEWAMQKKLLDTIVPTEQFWDDRFIKNANDILDSTLQ